MFRTIVIGYDGPERSSETAALAEVLRDPGKGTLLLASAYSRFRPPVGGLTLAEDIDVIRETTEALLAEARDALPDPSRAHVRAVQSDSPARVLADMAAAERADLVVVGSGRRREHGRLVPGTTAERLLHEAPCAVGVAPRGYTGGDVRRIGVACDGSPAGHAALRAAASLAGELSAALTVYCLDEPASIPVIAEAPVHVGAGAARRYRPEPQILHGVPAEEIAGRAYGVIDLLFVHRALLGRVSGARVLEAGCPVVVTR